MASITQSLEETGNDNNNDTSKLGTKIYIKDVKNQFIQFERNREKRKDLCMTYNKLGKNFDFLNQEEIHLQFRDFRREKKNGTIRINPNNNLTHEDPNGKKWHFLVIQEAKDGKIDEDSGFNMDICRLGMAFNFYVSGAVYAFRNKDNRDAMYHYVMK
jgi:hypothetical protein